MAISLSSGVRQSLQSLTSTAGLAQVAQQRLATGKKVNSAIDNPVNFFTAAGLNNRAGDFAGLLDGMSNSIQTIKSASTGIDAITKLVKSAQAAVSQARNSSEQSVRESAKKQFGELMTQIDDLAKDSGFNGINLLGTDELKTVFNEKTGANKNELTIKGGIDDDNDGGTTPNVAVSASSLGISGGAGDAAALTTAFGAAAADPDAPTDAEVAAQNTALDTTADSLKDALTSLTSMASSFGANLAIVQARKDFTSSMIDNLKIGADNLVNADTNEEGANLLALQTRQQLSQTALSLSSQADQAVLRLF
jgi:flagellin-like hook-associated protein FlgL